MLYWLTGTAASAARLYYENAHATPADRSRPRSRSALAAFGGDFSGIRRFADRDHTNIVHWSTFDHGGHFAAHKAPDLLVRRRSGVLRRPPPAVAPDPGPAPPAAGRGLLACAAPRAATDRR